MKLQAAFILVFILISSCINQHKDVKENKINANLQKFDIKLWGLKNSQTVNGIDLARYQGNLVDSIKPNVKLDFIICKATEGIDYIDPEFMSNWRTIRSKNLIRGAYHFYRNDDDPLKQAIFFANTIQMLDSFDFPPILDIEEGSIGLATSPNQLQKNVIVFLTELEKLCKRKPLIYSSLNFSNQYLENEILSNYDLWLAEYSGKKSPIIPNNWQNKGYLIWQKTDAYTIDQTHTDFDVFNGNKRSFIQYITTH